MEYKEVIDELLLMATPYALRLLWAIILGLVGYRVIRIIQGQLKRYFNKKEFVKDFSEFVVSVIGIVLKIVLGISVLGILGVQMSSLVAILAAVGFAIGMALSGTLQNFAGGIVLIILRPFKVGDFVETQGHTGSIESIQLFYTVMITVDNKKVVLPNGAVASGGLVNYNVEPIRRVDWKFGIGYGDDFDVAKQTLENFIKEDDLILKNPEFIIALSSLSDSSVDITVRAWVKTGDYWDVFFRMNERVYKEFGSKGLSIPFPQMDVHLKQSED